MQHRIKTSLHAQTCNVTCQCFISLKFKNDGPRFAEYYCRSKEEQVRNLLPNKCIGPKDMLYMLGFLIPRKLFNGQNIFYKINMSKKLAPSFLFVCTTNRNIWFWKCMISLFVCLFFYWFVVFVCLLLFLFVSFYLFIPYFWFLI